MPRKTKKRKGKKKIKRGIFRASVLFLLDFLIGEGEEGGYTISEISEITGFPKSTLYYAFQILKKYGIVVEKSVWHEGRRYKVVFVNWEDPTVRELIFHFKEMVYCFNKLKSR